jgi:hypothetical protein
MTTGVTSDKDSFRATKYAGTIPFVSLGYKSMTYNDTIGFI